MPVRSCGFSLISMVGLSLVLGRPTESRAQQQGGSPTPIQMRLDVAATPAGSAVSWAAVPGATRYVVHRWRREGNESRCCELHVQAGTALRYVDTALPGAGTYVYRVVAHLSGGRRRYQERTLQVAGSTPTASAPAGPAPSDLLNPADEAPVGPPPATIENPNPPHHLLQRAPRGGDGSTIANPDQPRVYPERNMPTGMVAATDPPVSSSAPTSAPGAPSGSAADGVPPAASGRYLVSAIGLYAGSVTTDNLLHEDGRGDEVFAAAVVRRYDSRTAELLETARRQTTVYGDVRHRVAERAQAGRLSSTGGIGNGDPIPGDAPAARTVPAQERVFPWKLWEGTLTEGTDAVVISPSIWEYDGRPALYDGWVGNQSALSTTLFLSQRLQDHIATRTFAPLALGATEASHPHLVTELKLHAPAVIAVAFGLPPILNFEGQDRPIGMVPGPSLPNTTIVLTREIIEAALARPALGVMIPTPGVVVPLPKPGMLVVNFEDRWRPSLTDRVALYSMVLQVERVP